MREHMQRHALLFTAWTVVSFSLVRWVPVHPSPVGRVSPPPPPSPLPALVSRVPTLPWFDGCLSALRWFDGRLSSLLWCDSTQV